MLFLNVRRNFSSDQKVFKRLVLPVGNNWRFRIFFTESVALSHKVPAFHKNLFLVRCSWVESHDERQKFLDVFVLFCRALLRDENFSWAKIFLASSLG